MKPCLGDPLIDDHELRARDGIVTGMQGAHKVGRRQAGATWILVARADEPVEDFFLESPFGAGDSAEGEDPVAWICRSVRPDGTVRLGAVNLEVDRFISDVLNDDLSDAILNSIR